MASHPSVFLSGESRQVWALHRETGEPHYLDVGEADEKRAFTKAHLRCPYPGCTVTINTRGGSKRDSYYHLDNIDHPGGPESEFHLAAKAMLAQWLREHVPEGATVREEQTIKEPEIDLHRRPDVLVTGQSGRQVAFEIEYKDWPVDRWRKKQGDLDRANGGLGIATLWLFGHTRLTLRDEAKSTVRVRSLIRAVLAARKPVLVVNPTTREIGTLVGRNRIRTEAPWGAAEFRLEIAALDECTFDPKIGLVTPTIDRFRREEEERAARLRAAEETETTRRLVGERGAIRVAEARAAYRQAIQDRTKTWEKSALRRVMLAVLGHLPSLFAVVEEGSSNGIWAPPEHWRAVIWDVFLRIPKPGTAFTTHDIERALAQHEIEFEPRDLADTVLPWMERLEALGVVVIVRAEYASGGWTVRRPVRWFETTGRPLGDAVADFETQQRARAAAAAEESGSTG